LANRSNNHQSSPSFEREIGIETFFTPPPGIGGHLRDSPTDFQVREIYQLPPASDQGRFMIAEVTSTNWETHTLVQELAYRLHINPRGISFAGTKDRRAVSTQLMSFEGVDEQSLICVSIKDVTIAPVCRSATPLHLGQLAGNRFTIVIRGCKDANEHLPSLLSPLESIQGFPNFFGIQRFGGVRSITHQVGRLLTQGDIEAAVMTYIANPLETESPQSFQLRKELEATRDFAAAYQQYPKSMNFERMMLERLAKNPTDFIDAIQALPKNLLLMFVSAYQSYLFNRMLSERIRRSIPFDQAVPGDLVGILKDSRLQDQLIPVSDVNLEKVNRQIKLGKAAVTGLLLGSESTISDGVMGEIEQKIMEEEKIEARSFIIPEVPFLSSSGSRRLILAPFTNLKWSIEPDERNPGMPAVQLSFELLKGCYATSFLRELMKAPKATDY
jgi:tRNA pseudouridine13 synthase